MDRNPYPPPPPWAASIASVGVTGTNGKTSTTRYIWAGLGAEAGAGPVARVTTVDAAIGERRVPLPQDHGAFLRMLHDLYQAGGRRAAIEATSATLGLGFARAWPFRVAVFTNLGLDHLRTHGTVEHVLASKAQLFVTLPPGGTAVLNADDPNAALLAEVLPPGVRTLWYAGPDDAASPSGSRLDPPPVDLQVVRATPSWSGLRLEFDASPHARALGLPPRFSLDLPTPARFQAPNVAAAVLASVALGAHAASVLDGLGRCPAPRGRFELVPGPSERPRVIVDYAHTPEAVEAVLASARALGPRQVTVVLGAGGDTDPGKRAPLAQAATAADRIWLTSDNPRHEDPNKIIDDLRAGAGTHPVEVELDRALAISRAISDAGPGDVVLILGKGHEDVQEIAGERLPLSDRGLALDALSR